MPIAVTVPLSCWLQSAFASAIEESFAQESERMAFQDEEEFGKHALDSEDFEQILRDLVDEVAVLDAVDEDYIESFARAASDEAEFAVALKRRKGDVKGSDTRLLDRRVALRLAGRETASDDELTSVIEDL